VDRAVNVTEEPERVIRPSAGEMPASDNAAGARSVSVSLANGLIVTAWPATTLTASGLATGAWLAVAAGVVGVGVLVASAVPGSSAAAESVALGLSTGAGGTCWSSAAATPAWPRTPTASTSAAASSRLRITWWVLSPEVRVSAGEA
jgi:hypothetical protein